MLLKFKNVKNLNSITLQTRIQEKFRKIKKQKYYNY